MRSVLWSACVLLATASPGLAADPVDRRDALQLAADTLKGQIKAPEAGKKLNEAGPAADDAVTVLIVAACNQKDRFVALEAIEVARPKLFPLIRRFATTGAIYESFRELSKAEDAAAAAYLAPFNTAVRSILVSSLRPAEPVQENTPKSKEGGEQYKVPDTLLADYWQWTFDLASEGDADALRAFGQIFSWLSAEKNLWELKAAGLTCFECTDHFFFLATFDARLRADLVVYTVGRLGRQRNGEEGSQQFEILLAFPSESLKHRDAIKKLRFEGSNLFQTRIDGLVGQLDSFEEALKTAAGKPPEDLVV